MSGTFSTSSGVQVEASLTPVETGLGELQGVSVSGYWICAHDGRSIVCNRPWRPEAVDPYPSRWSWIRRGEERVLGRLRN